jgi:hypothetical protein
MTKAFDNIVEGLNGVLAIARGEAAPANILCSVALKQRPKALLLKMPVVRKCVSQPFSPHCLHRNAIRQAIAFVGEVTGQGRLRE